MWEGKRDKDGKNERGGRDRERWGERLRRRREREEWPVSMEACESEMQKERGGGMWREDGREGERGGTCRALI